ncbi:membrane-bound O-acyltransferase gup1 isoform X3 [Macadamia integrifolia]|uniref:membrane-bound O-acyltransferase gup1 isoform X3 n=1 Tax=Macadamia integrifolia TaxID=60698 RepID=UPI001C530C5E|nr:membrane-bound O-acyltransferase gup1 isoform X3 [Macadamia integrifolia]
MNSSWKKYELIFLGIYGVAFYIIIICRSLQLSHDHLGRLFGLRRGWIANLPNDLSDSQWRNFRGNLPVLTLVMAIFILVANILRAKYCLKLKGMSIVWLSLSLSYLSYLHGACVIFIISIASANFFLVKIFSQSKYFLLMLWIFNIFVHLGNRVYEGYSFSIFGQNLAFLDNYRGTFRWHICFNFVILRMISYGYDYYWAQQDSCFDQKKHIHRCHICSSGKICYLLLQERSVDIDKFSLRIYLCYLVYAPLYIAGPIISFNAFASQLDIPQRNYSTKQVVWYGFRWVLSLFLMELMTHFFYYNAFATSGMWKQLSPLEVSIIGYGVLNFIWLKFFLIWRYFRFWALVGGVETPENMPRCINNCYDLESFWKNWHASFNKWLVRKLISWAWLTCLFFIPEIIMKSAVNALQAKDAFREFVLRELNAVTGAITITCLMVANFAGYVVGPSGVKWLISRFLQKDGLPVLGGMFATFYLGTKLMFHIRDARQRSFLKVNPKT